MYNLNQYQETTIIYLTIFHKLILRHMSSRQSKLQQYIFKMEKDRQNKANLQKKMTQPKNDKKDDLKNLQKRNFIDQINKKSEIQKDKREDSKNKQASKKQQINQKQKTIELQVSGSQSQQAEVSSQRLKKHINQIKKQKIKEINVQFYLNKVPSQPSGDLIDNIHNKWWGNFSLLESHHGYIQWIFPNSFQSRFNSLAKALTIEQAKKFRQNKEIAQRYQKSYMMMLQFYGLKLKNKASGQLVRSRHPVSHNTSQNLKQMNNISKKSSFYKQRFEKTFLTSFHNHMRITRILSSLVMCGFGRYAKQFSLFLNQQINGQNGALKQLKRYGVYDRQWKEYSSYVQKPDQINVILKN